MVPVATMRRCIPSTCVQGSRGDQQHAYPARGEAQTGRTRDAEQDQTEGGSHQATTEEPRHQRPLSRYDCFTYTGTVYTCLAQVFFKLAFFIRYFECGSF